MPNRHCLSCRAFFEPRLPTPIWALFFALVVIVTTGSLGLAVLLLATGRPPASWTRMSDFLFVFMNASAAVEMARRRRRPPIIWKNT